MSNIYLYALLGVGLFILGIYSLIVYANLLRKILAINVMCTGVFLVLVSLASRNHNVQPDTVPHAMVITGIVVAVSATALALILMLKINKAIGKSEFPDKDCE
ncbi:Na+/H+ antiporter subunit C [Shewanella frigidimarina]|uniref:NADH-quinone oxidoreductase subunit K n=1 Tax=Shewanella frigidimarina TaxID=56812 RepID=UPI000F4FB617|nr:NADH-quinone oxidoreductase subunit K [Shewanella frigidimarina]RPA63729.1 Na+/H+ antiporter subunit C [Shewanella frigidimarina]